MLASLDRSLERADSAAQPSPETAGAWAEALSGAAVCLSDLGWEDAAIHCFIAAGELIAVAEGEL